MSTKNMEKKRQKTYGSFGPRFVKDLNKSVPPLTRRSFVKLAGAAGTGSLCAPLAVKASFNQLLEEPEYRNYQPDIMAYRRLGKTNLMVSELSMGGASAYGDGGPSASSNPEAYQAMLQKLLDLGVNFFDTSPPTSAYDTEDKFAFLSGDNRDNVFISSKVDSVDPARLRQYVEDSLSSIQTDYLDIVYNHAALGVTEDGDYTEALRAFDVMDELKEEGKMRFSGFSGHSASVFKTLLEKYSDRVDVILGFYAPGHDWYWSSDPLEDWQEVYEIAKEKDVGVVGMKILLSGMDTWASRVAALEKEPAAMDRLQPYLDEGNSLPQSCIRWALANESIHSTVLGMRTMAEVEEDAGAIIPKTTGSVSRKPAGTALRMRSFPNPFKEFTTLQFPSAPAEGSLYISITDISGKLIRTMDGGSKRVLIWDGRDAGGNRTAPGRYFVSVRCSGQTVTKSLLKT